MKITSLNLSDLTKVIKKREISIEEVVRTTIGYIHETDPKIKAFITLREEDAINEARALDEKLLSGEDIGPLGGAPVALKDNICTGGLRTTCGSRMLENYLPPYDATVVKALKSNGAIIIGKTNMDEFAMGSSCENSAFFPTANPWNTDCVSGGSSGGSAAAVAAFEVPAALGSDTGGSVRQPAALCGTVGLKPTYGRVSRYGVVAYASSLDQVGTITRNVNDCALMMNAIAGCDPLDSTSVNMDVPDYRSYLSTDLKGLKVGIPREYFAEGIDPGVMDAVQKAVEVLQGLGARIQECSLRHTSEALGVYYVISPAEASSNLARFDGVRYGLRAGEHGDLLSMYKASRSSGFGKEVKRRIMLGTYVLSAGYYDADYLRALKARTLVKKDFEEAFKLFDLLVSPTYPTVAFKIGEKIKDPMQMYLQDAFTIPANLAGLPGISVPCGWSNELPVGLHLIGKPFDEGTLLRAAYAYEQAAEFEYVPPLAREGHGN